MWLYEKIFDGGKIYLSGVYEVQMEHSERAEEEFEKLDEDFKEFVLDEASNIYVKVYDSTTDKLVAMCNLAEWLYSQEFLWGLGENWRKKCLEEYYEFRQEDYYEDFKYMNVKIEKLIK